MRNKTAASLIAATVLTTAFTCAGGIAGAGETVPMTPELAAKREMVQRQQNQRFTDEKRKAAAEALKAERLKVYKAKQEAMQQSAVPVETGTK